MKRILERGGPLVRFSRQLVQRLRKERDDVVLSVLEGIAGGKRASVLDVFFAYRLLLGRPPDPAGFSHHRRRVDELELSPEELASDFLRSEEHRTLKTVEVPVVERWTKLDDVHVLVDANDKVIGGQLLAHQIWEPDVTRAVRTLLRAKDTFVDVGANIGYFSLLAAKHVGPEGRVIAIEPAPQNWALLEKSVIRNRFENVELHKVAAGSSNGTARLALPDRANGGSFSLVPDARPGSFDVPLRTLDSVIAGRPVHLVKLDIEGAEGPALDGMMQTLKAQRPPLLLELSGGLKLTERVAALGYGAMETAKFSGTFVAEPVAALEARLRASGAGHLDVLLFPR
jgi:FkbM family methyltransferase